MTTFKQFDCDRCNKSTDLIRWQGRRIDSKGKALSRVGWKSIKKTTRQGLTYYMTLCPECYSAKKAEDKRREEQEKQRKEARKGMTAQERYNRSMYNGWK